MKKILMFPFIFLPIITLAQDESIRIDRRKINSLLDIDPDKLAIDSPLILNNSIIFFYHGKANSVHVAGDFNQWKENLIMHESKKNFWSVSITNRLEIGKYRYRFKVDHLWISDPLNKNYEIDDSHTKLSIFSLTNAFIPYKKFPLWLKDNIYIFQHSSINADMVNIVGDFNQWDPYSHPLTYKGAGIFEITLELEPKQIYTYSFIQDGIWKNDDNNKKQFRNSLNRPVSAFYADQQNSIP